jgi:rare lipoprotein A
VASIVRTGARRWILSTALLATACGAPRPVRGPEAVSPPTRVTQHGDATYLARYFHGRTSASGEPFDERKLVAAHRTLPFGSVVRVTNVANGRSVTVRIIDRGPYGQNYREGAIIDVSRAAARRLRMLQDGQVPVRVEVLKEGDGRYRRAAGPRRRAGR